jgi:phosphoribosylformylglycinamidine cyclo-ligase
MEREMNSFSESYKSAGVDITAGYAAVELMKPFVKSTKTAGVLDEIGGFGGLFLPDFSGMKEPVLVSGTDGVGTKLKLAFLMHKHDTIGIDCVAMCVNDIVCCGAKPMFFLDYLAMGKNVPERVAKIVSGVANGCVQAGCALIGGESAEMPGFYPENEYDLAGFAVGIVDREKITDVNRQKAGDVVIALPSSGIHSNGFSLVRKVFAVNQQNLSRHYSEIGTTLGDILIRPTKIYVKPMLALMSEITVNGVAHITGGGFYENIPRAVKTGLCAEIKRESVKVLPIFDLIADTGKIPERDMFNTFNMGVGMVAVVDKNDADRALEILKANGEDAYIIGELVEADEKIKLI